MKEGQLSYEVFSDKKTKLDFSEQLGEKRLSLLSELVTYVLEETGIRLDLDRSIFLSGIYKAQDSSWSNEDNAISLVLRYKPKKKLHRNLEPHDLLVISIPETLELIGVKKPEKTKLPLIVNVSLPYHYGYGISNLVKSDIKKFRGHLTKQEDFNFGECSRSYGRLHRIAEEELDARPVFVGNEIYKISGRKKIPRNSNSQFLDGIVKSVNQFEHYVLNKMKEFHPQF